MTDYAFSDADLARIIDGTDTALRDLARLNVQVQGHEEAMIRVNNSDAGAVMRQRLGIWNDDFGRVRGALEQLNQKVAAVRHANTRAADHARDQAGSGT
jgi:hypothetical protein